MLDGVKSHVDFCSLCESMLEDTRSMLIRSEAALQELVQSRSRELEGCGFIKAGASKPFSDQPNVMEHGESLPGMVAPPPEVKPMLLPDFTPNLQTLASGKKTVADTPIDRPKPRKSMRRGANDPQQMGDDAANDEVKNITMNKGFFSSQDNNGVKLDEDLYDVTNMYKKEGCAQNLARSSKFEKLTLAVVAINAMYIGIDADNNTAETLLQAEWPYQLCDHLFCVFFTFELSVRFVAFARKKNCLKDMWFMFDTCLVTLMVAETWVLTLVLASLGGGNGVTLPTGPLRLLRLLRLSRLVRLLRALPELLTLVNGMRVAMRSVSSSLILVVLINYVFAIVMYMFLGEAQELEANFGTLGNTMWTLGLDGTFMDSTRSLLDSLKSLETHGYDWTLGWSMVLVFVIYILLTNVTVMNMLIGVLCEVVSAVKVKDDEKIAIDFMKQHLRGMLVQLDADLNGQVSKTELAKITQLPQAIKVLEELEVNAANLLEVTEQLYEDDKAAGRVQEVTREELMEVILKVRGNREVSMHDLVEARCDLRRLMNRRVDEITSMIQELSDRFDRCFAQGALQSKVNLQRA